MAVEWKTQKLDQSSFNQTQHTAGNYYGWFEPHFPLYTLELSSFDSVVWKCLIKKETRKNLAALKVPKKARPPKSKGYKKVFCIDFKFFFQFKGGCAYQSHWWQRQEEREEIKTVFSSFPQAFCQPLPTILAIIFPKFNNFKLLSNKILKFVAVWSYTLINAVEYELFFIIMLGPIF